MAHGTPLISQDDDDDALWEVKEIADEIANKYKVVWAGADPDTGKPWEPSWVDKSDCTGQAVAQWEKRKIEKMQLRNNKSGTDEQVLIPAGKRKRQREDARDADLRSIGNSEKPTKHMPPCPPSVHSSSTAQAVHPSPSMKIGPPRSVKRKKEMQTTANASFPPVQKSSQSTSNASLFAALPSAAPSSPSNSIHLRQEGTSEGKANYSQDVPPSPTTKIKILPSLASTSVQTVQTPPSCPSQLLRAVKEIKELQYGISIASNTALKLVLETDPVSVSLQDHVEKIERLQCQISIASNATLKLVLEALEMLE